MSFAVTFLVLSLLGALNAGHLVSTHVQKRPLICPLNHDCGVVTRSRWATIFGVRNDVLGLCYFLLLIALILLLIFSPATLPHLGLLLFYGTLLGFLFSVFLVGLQAFVIKEYCFYCMLSALIATLLFINSFALF